MTVNGVLSLFPETKEQQSVFVERMIESVLDGNANILKTEAQMANMQAVIASYRKDDRIKDALLNEAEKYGKSFDLYHAKYEIKNVAVKYDFSDCNDVELEEINKQLEELNGRRKERETLLKALKKPQTIIDEDSGEVIEIRPPVKTSSTQVVVTIK